MTQYNGKDDLERAARAVRNDEPLTGQVREAGARIWQNLQGFDASAQQTEPIRGCEDISRLLPAFAAHQLSPERMLLVETHLHECPNCRAQAGHRPSEVKWTPVLAMRPSRQWSWAAVAAAVVVVAATAFILNNMYFAVPAGARATVQSVDGVAYRISASGEKLLVASDELNQGDVLRTGAGSHAYVKLSDGSVVEVNERTSFAVTARGKDITIALDRGAVIIEAPHRDAGYLYVKTPDARVKDTGTVFAVNAAMKGSRVSVVEGTVEVTGGGRDEVLRAGDQISTSANLETVPLEQEIAWSRDKEKHLEFLAQISHLQKKLAEVQLPPPRYNSELLNRMPADSVVYVSMPNAGQALEDANLIFQEQLQQSETLRQWWAHGDPNATAKLNETISKIRQLSDYLGDEVVIVGFSGTGNNHGGVAVVATVRRSGLRDFLETQFTSDDGKKFTVTDQSGLASLSTGDHAPVALIRQNEVVFSSGRDILERVNAALNSGAGLGQTQFGQRIAEAYTRGAGFLLAADLHQLMNNPKHVTENKTRKDQGLERSGFGDMRYLIVEHREVNGLPDNRLVLDFSRERRGAASWLGAPAPMGSLDFVNRNAALAVAFIAKDPQLIFADMLNMSGSNPAKQQAEIADFESRLNVRIREDLAAHFGGDGVIALDGPVLPTPSWKLVIEVHDEAGLAESLQKVVAGINAEAQHKGKPGVELRTEDVNGQRYYIVHSLATGTTTDVYYTFSAGYMILGPNRATVMNTLQTRANGDSLARSGEFKAMLPKDQNGNYSLIAYQNLGPILQPLSAQVTGNQAKILQELASDARPSVACAWGQQNRIEAVTNSRLLGFDWLALTSLLENKGTKAPQKP